MRARTVYKKAYCFDFDECLVNTNARIHVYRNGVFIKSLTSKEYNYYKKNPKDTLDFSEFTDGELILKAKKYTTWPIIKNVSDAIKQERSTSDIYILTARPTVVKSYIYEFLKTNGIDIDIKHIITVGDAKGNVNIAKEKRKILTKLSKKYDQIYFFDDDPNNIKLAASIPGIKTRLVENKINEKFEEKSDPISDMGIGFKHIKELWKKENEKAGQEYPITTSWRYFGNDKHFDDAYTIFIIMSIIIQKNPISLDEIQEIFNNILKNDLKTYSITLAKVDFNKVKEGLKNFYNINVEISNKNKINEKFTDESDPIRDLGIGIFSHRDFKTEKKLLQWVWFVLPTILGGKIPKDIINNPYDTGFFKGDEEWNKVENYVQKYLTLNGESYEFEWDVNNAFHNALRRKGYKVSKKYEKYWEGPEFKDKSKYKINESLNEKFTDESDPIKDLGIGIEIKIKNWLKKMDIKKYTLNKNLSINTNQHVDLNEKLKNTGKLPDFIQFNIAHGAFYIAYNNLTTLRGCPKKVMSTVDWRGSFRCNNNKLTSLKYSPKLVDGVFSCEYNTTKFIEEDVRKVCEVKTNIEV